MDTDASWMKLNNRSHIIQLEEHPSLGTDSWNRNPILGSESTSNWRLAAAWGTNRVKTVHS